MKTKLRINKEKKIPLELSVEGKKITFLFPPEESKDYFLTAEKFSNHGWRLPTARELSLLLTSARSNQGRNIDIMSLMILRSWDYGLQSCTYLHPTSEGLFVLEASDLKDLSSIKKLEDKIKVENKKILFLPGNYSKEKFYFGVEKEFEFFERITCGGGLEDFLNFRINKGFVSFTKEEYGPTPKHDFGILSLKSPANMLYYPVLITSDNLPRLNATSKEKARFAKQIDKFIKEKRGIDKIERSSGKSTNYSYGDFSRSNYFDPDQSELDRRDYEWERGS